MGVAIALGVLFPGPGAEGGILQPHLLTKAGVALIFFLHGLTLSFESLRGGVLHWRLHLIVQSCTFLLFPLLGLVFLWAAPVDWFPPELDLGIFFLCALSSTVSSSVAMTALAKGNVPAAVFNATLSSILGVVLTPLWVGVLLKTGGKTLALGGVMLDLTLWLLLPLALGQAFRPLWGAWARRHKPTISRVDRVTILLLIYTSFCESTQSGLWSQGHPFLAVGLVCAGLLLVAIRTTSLLARRLGLSRPDRIAAIFCGSKKSLATGVAMAALIFGKHPALGLILLPIIIYHSLQLVVAGWLASRWGREAHEG